jgi:DNA mismatch repair protein MutL
MSSLLANQIAAGEVVERPASVIKELLENCLDAGATQIQIDLERSGIERIRIRDDGCGIVKDDLLLAISRHATSKVLQPEDLQAINSLGFRGEALASIAAVAKISLTSKAQDTEHAWCLQYDPSQDISKLEPAAHPQGTTIEVNHLFFNVPARRKFLRSERTELGHVETIVKQIALSHHHAQIILKHQQSTLFSARKATNELQIKQRVAAICGQPFIDTALEVDCRDDAIRLYGWLGQADSARSQTDTQYFYVNGRIVRDKLLNHAVKMAYQDLIPEGRYPCYVLYLDLPPEAVDVNVHPTKHEVRFYEARQIHDFVTFHLDRTLHGSALNQTKTNMTNEQQYHSNEMQFITSDDKVNIAQSVAIQEPSASYRISSQLPHYHKTFDEKSIHFSSITPHQIPSANKENIKNDLPEFKLIGIMKNEYILVEIAQGLLIIDLERAQQTIAYHAMLSLPAEQIINQPLLLPTAFTLTTAQSEILENLQLVLSKYGIQLTRVAEQRWLLRELPKVLKNLDLTDAIFNLIETKCELTHEQFCLQFAKHIKLPSSFSFTNIMLQEVTQALLKMTDWQNHALKACRIIKWSELL